MWEEYIKELLESFDFSGEYIYCYDYDRPVIDSDWLIENLAKFIGDALSGKNYEKSSE